MRLLIAPYAYPRRRAFHRLFALLAYPAPSYVVSWRLPRQPCGWTFGRGRGWNPYKGGR